MTEGEKMGRYENVSRLPNNLYTQGSPLLIAAGALLKDNQTGNILVQIKFRSLSNKEIKAVKVHIKAFDVSATEIQGVEEYQYLDLSVSRNEEFGQKTAISLPDAVTRSFSVACTSVIFLDNTIWKAEKDAVWEPLPQQQNLENSVEDLAQQYRRDTSPQSCFEPLEYRDVWLCSCGAVNKRGESRCCSCGVNRNTIFSVLNTDFLTQNQAQFEAEETERKNIEEQEKKKQQAKTKKIVIFSSAAAVVVIAAVMLLTQVFIPMQKYNSAVSLMNAEKYEEAIPVFEELGDYQDSKVNLLHCKIQYEIKQGDYLNGIVLLVDKISSVSKENMDRNDYDLLRQCVSKSFSSYCENGDCGTIYKVEYYDSNTILIYCSGMDTSSMTYTERPQENLKVWLIGIEASERDNSYLIAEGEIEKEIVFDFA